MKSIHLEFKTNGYLCGFFLCLLVLVFPTGMVCKIFAAELTQVTIEEKVRIDDEKIFLGRIAKIEGNDLLLLEKLNGIVIGSAPLPGYSRELEKSILKRRLKQNGIDLKRLMLLVPPKVSVTRGFVEISQNKIKMLVSDYIQKNLTVDQENARIRDIRVTENLRLPKGRITYNVIAPRNRELIGKIPLSINFDVNGKFYKKVWATVTLEIFAEVVITKRPLGRHKPITEDDIHVQKVNLANLPFNVITDPEEVLGKRTRRAVGAKTVLRANLIEFPPLVKRGDVVMIIAESNGLKITALGQVKKKGRVGERIPVINFDSKKTLYARVLNSNMVKVEF